MMHGTGTMGFPGHMWIPQVIIFLLFFLVFWWLIKNNNQYGFKSNSKDTAEEILKKRLASGEISLKDFKQLKKEIQ